MASPPVVAHNGSVKPRLLVIDDDLDIRELLVLALAEEFDVVLASSVDEARQRISERSNDLILLDLMMPGLSGGAFLLYLEKYYPDLSERVYLMTGMPPEIVESMAPGMLGRLIRKPIDFTMIGAKLRALL